MKRCIDEIEKRGLDIIGIYRLCGADAKKNMLRMAFEDSPEIVDLSSANVPDINVITGIQIFQVIAIPAIVLVFYFCFGGF